MGTKLERISQLSKENPDMVFTSVWHIINIDLLKVIQTKTGKEGGYSKRERQDAPIKYLLL